MRPRANVPPRSTNPGCEGDRAVAALSPTSGPMAGVGQGTVGGLPHAHRGLRHSQQGSWRPTEQGLRGARLGGLRDPPGAHCTGKYRCRLPPALILPGGTRQPDRPSRIILERINYEIVN